jgi:molybdopterin converting factor small subunit
MSSTLNSAEGIASSATSIVKIRLPRALVNLFRLTSPVVELSATTMNEVMNELDARWPGIRDRLCDSRPAVRKHINIFVDGKRATLQTRLEPGAEVTILTAISGG